MQLEDSDIQTLYVEETWIKQRTLEKNSAREWTLDTLLTLILSSPLFGDFGSSTWDNPLWRLSGSSPSQQKYYTQIVLMPQSPSVDLTTHRR